MTCALSVSQKIFKNPTANFFMPKEKIRTFDWWVDHISATFNFRCEKAENVFCKMSQQVYPERPFEFRFSKCKRSEKNLCFSFVIPKTQKPLSARATSNLESLSWFTFCGRLNGSLIVSKGSKKKKIENFFKSFYVMFA